MMRGSDLTQGAQMVNDQLSLAKQRAVSRNRMVEVRFYRYADPEIPGESASDPSTGHFRALQLFEFTPDPNGSSGIAEPLDKVRALPGSMILASGSTLSTLLNQPKRPSKKASSLTIRHPIPRVGEAYEYVAFRFGTDGSTDLTKTDRWFLTVHDAASGDDRTEPPPNFATIQVDPANGNLRIFRP
jgi:uncharacterized protein (TIGR02596 family)